MARTKGTTFQSSYFPSLVDCILLYWAVMTADCSLAAHLRNCNFHDIPHLQRYDHVMNEVYQAPSAIIVLVVTS